LQPKGLNSGFKTMLADLFGNTLYIVSII